MPLYPDRVAEQLEANKAEIHRFTHDDSRVVEVYRDRLREAVTGVIKRRYVTRSVMTASRTRVRSPTREVGRGVRPVVPFARRYRGIITKR